MITLQELRLVSESLTREPWGGPALNADFSRLYYILEGEAYYEEMGKQVRLKKGHLYLTPAKKSFGLHDNPDNQLLHTYAHVTTLPVITHFAEIAVTEGTPLSDAVALWRRHVHSKDKGALRAIVQLVLSCIEPYLDTGTRSPEERIREQLHLANGEISMQQLSHRLGYSREHLTRVFKSAYHTTPRRYCDMLRMERAAELLLQGTPVYRVAQELHYASPYAFSKAFKKHFGMAPRPYAKSFSQANGT